MVTRLLLSLAFLAVTASALADGRLCPPPAPIAADSDDLRITEDEITAQKYRESLEYLRTELPKRVDALPPGSNVDRIEGFWLSYFNSLSFIEGYTLKTAALLERARRPGKTGGPAEKRFCSWLKKAEYVD
jgi:hypothetical protein